MSRYAEATQVSSDRSRAEIESTLRRYGADGFMYGWDREMAVVAFRAHGRHVRFRLPMPDPADREFTHIEDVVMPACGILTYATIDPWPELAPPP